MPSIAEQDYIIIDWKGKGSSDTEKKAEVDAILKNLYLANPLSMLSVVFKDYDSDAEISMERCVSFFRSDAQSGVFLIFSGSEAYEYTFGIV